MLENLKSYALKQGSAFLLLLSFAACGGSSSQVATAPPPAAPTVVSSNPANGANGVALNGSISASFSEAMDPSTLNANTFTVTYGSSSVPVPGTVVYANSTAVFWPSAHLMSDTTFTATITTGAKTVSGTAMAAKHVWSVTTGHDMMPGLPVGLGTAGNFAILAKSGISTVPASAITGNIGVSPAAATYITGFSLTADPSNVFSTSTQVVGKVYAANYAVPTPSNMTTAVSDMQLAFTDAAGRAPDFTELGAGNIGGMTLVPGVYKWGTGLLIPTNVTLAGSATDVWIFEIAQNLTMANASNIFLAGGALSRNVFWQVSGAVSIGTTAHCEGIILSQTAIALQTGASINGRLLAQTAVTLDASTVTDGGSATGPMVLSTTPLNGATGVPLNASVSASFSVPMDPTTFTPGTFTLTSAAGSVLGTVAYANSTAVFTPATPLASNRMYLATITTGARNALGVALAANHAWSFTTGGGSPNPPTVLSSIPQNGAANVSVNGSVSATFSETMDHSTLTASTFTLASSAGAVLGSVAYANSTAVFTPSSPLAGNTTFTATITTGAKSASGIALAANHSWTFTTGAGNQTTPTVLSNTPLSGAAGVPLNGIISATFSEAMNHATLTTGTFTLASSAGPVVGMVTYVNATAAFQPAAPLASGTTFTATVTTGAKSALGVALAANYSWSFTTVAQNPAPAVISNTPLNGVTGVLLNGSISATFSAAMDRATLTTSTFTLTSGAGVVPGSVTYSGMTAAFLPTAPLASNTTYTATITTGAKSALGVALPANHSWSFTTARTPTTPTVLSNIPLNAATGVPLNTSLSAIFSEAMDHTTLTAGTFTLASSAGSVSGTVAYAASTAVFTPAAPLASHTLFTATLTTGAKSDLGVALAANYTWTFTTGAGNPTTPTVLSNSPLNGATGVPPNGIISATFSEAMDHATLTSSTFTLTSGAGVVMGMVSYSNSTAAFLPAAQLASNTTFTATITSGAKSALGVALASTYTWTFTTAAATPVTPTVLSKTPPIGATGVALNSSVSATFSVAMDNATLTAGTFTLTSSSGAVAGTVAYANSTAVFTPGTPLANGRLYTATITNGAKSALGVALAANYSWTFTTVTAAPTVLSNVPLNGATGVSVNPSISATFSTAMDQTTLTASTFTLTSSAGSVTGSVVYANSTAVFTPGAPLANNRLYTATITTGAKSAAGVALAANHSWTFTTAAAPAPGLPVNLGTAGNFAILTKTGISTVPTSAITGDIGVSPAAATYITGFALTADPSNVFSTSTQVTGRVYAANYAVPTPSNMTTAVSDMELAFTAAAGRAADVTELGAGNIGGMTLVPGVYKWGTGLLIPTNVTLTGSATDVWIFQVAQNLNLSSGVRVLLAGGALPKNVFWQVSGSVDFGTTSHCEGIVLTQTAVTMRTGSSINGRLLAQTAVTLDSSTVVQPAP